MLLNKMEVSMRNKKLLAIAAILVGLIIILVLSDMVGKIDNEENARVHQHIDNRKPIDETDTSLDITAEGFSTHLPVVILNTNGQQIMSKLDTDGDPKINIEVQIIDNEDSLNSIGDTPAVETISTVRYRGNSSLYYDKKQYALEFLNA